MKRLLPLLACLLLFFSSAAAGEAEKLTAMPVIFLVSVTSEERVLGDNEQLIYKEYLHTTHEGVNRELKGIVDAFDEEYSPQVPKDERKNARRNNRLDVETTYYRTGESWLSALIQARVTAKRQQTASPFATRTYDLLTGERVTLSRLFDESSAAWELMGRRVDSHLREVFPAEARDEQLILTLASKEALMAAEFTLGAAELTLHYEARTLFPGKTGLIHVRFFYPEFKGMMTAEGERQTDNRRFRMVAITPDDGPRHNNSIKALNALRMGGARATFFTVGKLYLEGMDILQRQFDGNHIVASHGYNHWSGYSMGAASRIKELARSDEIMLEYLGEKARFFRAPGGTYPPWAEAPIGLPIIQWSVDTYDFKGLEPERILNNVKKNVRDGDIILMHDTGDKLFKAVPLICDYLTANGYLMVSVEELAVMQGVKMEPNIVYHRFVNGDFSERRDSNTN